MLSSSIRRKSDGFVPEYGDRGIRPAGRDKAGRWPGFCGQGPSALEIPACRTEAAESSFESAVRRIQGDWLEYIVHNYVFILVLSLEIRIFVFSSPQREAFKFTEGAGPCFYRKDKPNTGSREGPFMLFMMRGVQLVAVCKHTTRRHHAL